MPTVAGEEAQQRAYAFMKQKIATMAYRPQERLYAHVIAGQIQTSRTPVREALGRLVQEGLVQKAGGWGYVVRGFTTQEIRDLYNVRRALEVEAAREAAANCTPADIERIEKLLQQAATLLQRGRAGEFVVAARKLHMAIAQCSRNELLVSLLASIHERVQALAFFLHARITPRAAQVLQENTEIVAALKARELPRLEQLICAHLRAGCESSIEALRDAHTP